MLSIIITSLFVVVGFFIIYLAYFHKGGSTVAPINSILPVKRYLSNIRYNFFKHGDHGYTRKKVRNYFVFTPKSR